MKKEDKIIKYLENKYKKKIKLNSKLFFILDIDSFEFIKLVNYIQNILRKKYKPILSNDIADITLKKFLTFFK
tara:strand:- start:529 stop:747 length:219 start_codon:yes stop_codon:yes gene_type:complete